MEMNGARERKGLLGEDELLHRRKKGSGVDKTWGYLRIQLFYYRDHAGLFC